MERKKEKESVIGENTEEQDAGVEATKGAWILDGRQSDQWTGSAGQECTWDQIHSQLFIFVNSQVILGNKELLSDFHEPLGPEGWMV